MSVTGQKRLATFDMDNAIGRFAGEQSNNFASNGTTSAVYEIDTFSMGLIVLPVALSGATVNFQTKRDVNDADANYVDVHDQVGNAVALVPPFGNKAYHVPPEVMTAGAFRLRISAAVGNSGAIKFWGKG